MRLLVTGGRRYADAECVAALLDRALVRERDPEILVVVHGACGVDAGDEWTPDDVTGADGLAHRWALWRMNQGRQVEIEAHPAAWTRGLDLDLDPGPTYRARVVDRGAGMRRNAEMVATLRPGVDAALSFPGGPGTAHATQLALNRGIRVGCPVRERDGASWQIRWFGGPGSVVGPRFDGRAGRAA